MKKLPYVLAASLLATLLAGCVQETPNSSETSSEEASSSVSSSESSSEVVLTPEEKLIQGLQTGFGLTYTMHKSETWPKSDPTLSDEFFEVASEKDFTQFRQWEGVENKTDGTFSKGSLLYNSIYTPVAQGTETVLGIVSLGLDNKISTSFATDSEGNVLYWEPYGMQNPFDFLTADALTPIEGGYAVDFTKAAKKATYNLAAVLYGYYYTSLESFEIVMEDGAPKTFKASFQSISEKIMGVDVVTKLDAEGEFTSFNNPEAVKGNKVLEGAEDETFAAAMKSLQGYNWQEDYTINQGKNLTDPTLEKYSSGVVKAYDKQFTMTTYYRNGSVNYDQGYYALDEGGVQGTNHLAGGYYKDGKPHAGSFPDDFLPKFEISSLFFDKEGNTYTLNKDRFYSGYATSYVFSTLVDYEVTDLKITIDGGKVTFENTIPAGAHTVTKQNVSVFSKIGEFNAPLIDVSAVHATTEGLTWSQIFKGNSSYSEVLEMIDETSLDAIPLTNDDHSTFSLYADAATETLQFQIKTTKGDDEEGAALAKRYGEILVKEGWSTPTENEDGNMVATKKVGDKTVQVAYYFDDLDYYLVIMPSIVTTTTEA